VRKAAVLDWLAHRDPDDGSQLKQIDIAKLAGVAQGAVSRIARAAAGVAE
jgi:predicted XRE-type DNA-binding protein